jgi:hypothetical protein
MLLLLILSLTLLVVDIDDDQDEIRSKSNEFNRRNAVTASKHSGIVTSVRK